MCAATIFHLQHNVAAFMSKILLFISFALIGLAFSSSTKATDGDFDLNELNYGFSNYLGSGIYRVAGRTVQVYQIPFALKIKTAENSPWNLSVTLPVTIGFYDFKSGDFLDFELPSNLSTVSIMPGFKALYSINKEWVVGPFIDAGVVNNFETSNTSQIYGAGLLSFYEYPFNQTVFTLSNRLLYAKDSGAGIESAGEYSSFESFFDFRFLPPLFGYNMDISVYYANFRYFSDLSFLRPIGDRVNVHAQHEVGFTFGLNHLVDYKYLSIPRLGIGYRFGDNLSIVKLVIGASF